MFPPESTKNKTKVRRTSVGGEDIPADVPTENEGNEGLVTTVEASQPFVNSSTAPLELCPAWLRLPHWSAEPILAPSTIERYWKRRGINRRQLSSLSQLAQARLVHRLGQHGAEAH